MLYEVITEIRYYSIIYDVVDDVKKALEGMLTPELKENIIGYAEIRDVFRITSYNVCYTKLLRNQNICSIFANQCCA